MNATTTASPDGGISWAELPESRDVEERLSAGKRLRARASRTSHAGWTAPADRPDPLAVLARDDASRMAELLPVRYGRMSQSPFTFFRGAAAVMASDLASTPLSGIRTQVCGDAHLLNFGGFATAERRLIFDVNDFDETCPGPWEWDLKRLLASVAVAARQLDFRATQTEACVLACAASYREHVWQYSGEGVLEVWYARLDERLLAATIRDAAERRRAEAAVDKARASDRAHFYPTISDTDPEGYRRIVDQPPLLFHPGDDPGFGARAHSAFALYRASLDDARRALVDRFRVVDAAYKVVGVGSVGTRCLVLLLMADEDDVLVLQAKEARASALEPYVGASAYKCGGERVVNGQHLMQAASDLFLGWASDESGRDFYIRQLRDMKSAANVDRMTFEELRQYVTACGWALARAHSKAGGVAPLIAGYTGRGLTLDQALLAFALDYAEQNERDYNALKAAVQSGAIAIRREN